MERPGRMHRNDHRGIAQGVGIVVVLAVALGALSVFYVMARQQAYAETGSINFAKLPKANTNVNANSSTN